MPNAQLKDLYKMFWSDYADAQAILSIDLYTCHFVIGFIIWSVMRYRYANTCKSSRTFSC